MDDFRARARWRDAGFWNHFGHGERDEARRQENNDEKGAGQETQRTVCKDDEFVCRGANPRTGIVSPFIFGEGSGNVWQDLERPAEKTDQRRAEDQLRCGQLANMPLIRTTQKINGEPSCTKSSEALQHTKLFSHIKSRPTSIRDEQIQEYQGNLADVYRSKAQNAAGMRTLIANLTPPPTELRRIRRKKVGSGQVSKVGSTNSELCENLRQDSAKKVPTNDVKASGSSTIVSVEPWTAPLTVQADQLHGSLENYVNSRNTIAASAVSNAKSAVSSKYIAHLHFLRPTHSASQTTSYRRSRQILAKPPRKTDSRDNRHNISNTSTADTSCKPWKSEQRPQVYRKFGTTSIPTVDFHESQLEGEGKCLLSLAPQGNASITKQSTRDGRIDPKFQHFNHQERSIPILGREKAKVPAVRPRPCRQCVDLQTEYLSKPIDVLDHQSSTNIITCDKNSQSLKDGLVCRNGNIHVGKHTNRDVLRMKAEPRPEKLGKTLSRSTLETGFAFSLEIPDKDWLMDLHPCIGCDKADTSCTKFIEQQDAELSYPEYIAQRWVEVSGFFTKIGGSFTTSIKIEYICKWLLHMIRHTTSTLHHSSPALRVIANSNPMIGEYISAMVSLMLAILYLLMLLNILIALGKIIKLMGKTLWLIWVPTRVVVLLLKWCIFG